MAQKAFLNLGCGRIILPGPQPGHHQLVDGSIYAYPLWHNVDRNPEPGVDETVDLFTYPWPWADNSFDGALLTHIAEHIPHGIDLTERASEMATVIGYDLDVDPSIIKELRLAHSLKKAQDGWYAFFAELYRVLTPGAIVHILSPYGWSQGAITDPTHTRYLTEQSFTHSMQPDPNSPFKYETGGINFRMTQDAHYTYTQLFAHLFPQPTDAPEVQQAKFAQLQYARQTQLNVAYELYVKLEAVKE